MSLLNGNAVQAREVLDFCMANESPELKAKVFEIISHSGLEPDDPMFMALLLTGQMRVFLEAAPAELHRLLSEWKQESADSLSEISNAISRVKRTQIEQAEAIEESMEAVCNKCVSDIKDAGMGTVGAIAEANSETLEQIRQTKQQNEKLWEKLVQLDAKFDAREQRSAKNINALIEWVGTTTKRQERVNQQISKSLSKVEKIQQDKVWLKIAEVFWSIPALVVSGLILVVGTWWFASR